jgi:putative ABC transport system permease protein
MFKVLEQLIGIIFLQIFSLLDIHLSLKTFSSTYITSFYIPSDKQYLAADLMREFRTVSVFSIEELIEQIKEIIEQVTQALNSILLLTSLSALFLAFSALQDGFSVRNISQQCLEL